MPFHPDTPYWLAASYLPDIGSVKFSRWLTHFEDIKTLFSATPSQLQKSGLNSKEIKSIKNLNWSYVERDLKWSETQNCFLVSFSDTSYPQLLRETIGAPFVLYGKGDKHLLSKPQLAIVGSRNPTTAGYEIAAQFAMALAKAGFVVTSGMALGIDAACHTGALSAGGKTIAVMGTGMNHIYPAAHQTLSEKIIAEGALITEFPPDIPPKPKNFPQRNRIISGLSLGVIVAEAALQSGSLITARYAIEQGREVFAIPGSIHNPMAKGCNHLIRQGAKLIETAEDIFEELEGFLEMFHQNDKEEIHQQLTTHFSGSYSEQEKNVDPILQNLLTHIGYESTALDTILVRSGLTAGEVSSMLLSLELQGLVETVAGGYVRLPNRVIPAEAGIHS